MDNVCVKCPKRRIIQYGENENNAKVVGADRCVGWGGEGMVVDCVGAASMMVDVYVYVSLHVPIG